MDTPTSLVNAQPQTLATVQQQAPSLLDMMRAVVAGGVTTENVGVLKEMLAINERMEIRNAEKDFNAAFTALQNDMPTIIAESVIPNRGKYAKFEDVMWQISPMLSKHGFSVSFSMTNDGIRVVETCTLRHIGGHSQSNSFGVRVGKADSDTQADCKAATTAKRNALLNCLNIVVRQDALQNEDDDASLEGGLISPDKVIYLRERLQETNSDLTRFLQLAGAESLETIRSGSYDVLVRALAAKKKA